MTLFANFDGKIKKMQWKSCEISNFLYLKSQKLFNPDQVIKQIYLMNTRPLHENLDTSFVNLAALIRHLRQRQFVGKVRVELRGYEADVILTTGNEMRVLERDCVAGRISEGEEALQRLLIRARESGGAIHVHQKIEEVAPLIESSVTARRAEKYFFGSRTSGI